jgi:SAM-dependent methyltransferase
MAQTTGSDGGEVRAQYESFPYPPRDPAQELQELRPMLLAQLALVNHAVWGGWRMMGPGFRVLDAGCGTGDNTVFAASLLRGTGAEVVGLDFSEASLAITAARLRARGLDGVRLVRGAIEDAGSLQLGTFDYIVSAGVLHHLPSPEAGLQALTEVLAPDGALGIMVYGQYGRTAVYQLQALLRLIAPASMPAEERLRRTKAVLAGLGPDHWATFARAQWEAEARLHGDAGLYDLLLHSTDRAYTVPDLHAWLGEANLRLLRFDVPAIYEPRVYNDAVDYQHLSPVQRQAAAELLNGRMAKHLFFAARVGAALPASPAPNDEAAVPTWLNFDPVGWFAEDVANAPVLDVEYETLKYQQPLDPISRALFVAVDGRRSLRAVLDEVAARFPKVARASLLETWQRIYQPAATFNLLGMFPPRG